MAYQKKKPHSLATARIVSHIHTRFIMANNNVLPPGGLSRQRKLEPILPFAGATLWRKIKAGEFPAPIKISENITAWRNDDVNDWFSQWGSK